MYSEDLQGKWLWLLTEDSGVAKRLDIESRLTESKETLDTVSSKKYLKALVGTLGRQPIEDYAK